MAFAKWLLSCVSWWHPVAVVYSGASAWFAMEYNSAALWFMSGVWFSVFFTEFIRVAHRRNFEKLHEIARLAIYEKRARE